MFSGVGLTEPSILTLSTQVWGLSTDDDVYNRTDVSPTQISGQTWQIVEGTSPACVSQLQKSKGQINFMFTGKENIHSYNNS